MIKRITLLIAIGLLGLISDARMKPLRFVNGTFKIVQFTDLHWVEDSSFKTKNDSTLNLMRDILNAEKPDLAVITGDVVVGSNAKPGWDKICKLFEESHVPFVVTFGNHDHESDMSNAEILEYIADKPYNLTFDEDRKIHGSGNCSMPVKASEGSGDRSKHRKVVVISGCYISSIPTVIRRTSPVGHTIGSITTRSNGTGIRATESGFATATHCRLWLSSIYLSLNTETPCW